ncbi:MAG: magnesium chelatase domain-containing protein, partial [Patescibacteria group bacterium]
TVLYLEGELFLSFRILRCIKNRFGSTNEVGVFEMKEQGLKPVSNPSSLFLSQRVTRQPGNAVTCTVEGSRAMMLEVQALTAKAQFNYPKRAATGFDLNRVQLLSAVLQKRLRLNLFEQDIFISVAGGFRVTETACDLAAALSVISSFKDTPLPDDLVIIGEVGLSGEIRPVGMVDKRIKEAARLGFKRILLPAGNKALDAKIKLLPVSDLQQAVSVF